MTHGLDVARSGGLVARWCAFAEQRLDYLTELFETGRWRRYHSERAFLENIQEAKTAVEVWRDLATREASRNNRAVASSWLDRPRTARSGEDGPRDQVPQAAQVPVYAPVQDVPLAAQPEHAGFDEAPFAPVSNAPVFDAQILDTQIADAQILDALVLDAPVPDTPVLDEASEQVPDIDTIEQRYPLLRNRL